MTARLERFTVKGSARFPLDMLRHDVCVPVGPEDVGAMEASLLAPGRQQYSVTLYAKSPDRRCAVGRWASCGWHVSHGFLEGGEPWRPERLEART